MPNRRAFEEHFEREVARANRTQRPFALLLADVDRFKEINDRFGHVAGDEALSELGRLLPAELRHYDVPARVGGDEFAVLLPDIEASEARILGDRVTRNVSEQMQLVGAPLNLSFGVATFGRDGLTLDELTAPRTGASMRPSGRHPAGQLAARARRLRRATASATWCTRPRPRASAPTLRRCRCPPA